MSWRKESLRLIPSDDDESGDLTPGHWVVQRKRGNDTWWLTAFSSRNHAESVEYLFNILKDDCCTS